MFVDLNMTLSEIMNYIRIYEFLPNYRGSTSIDIVIQPPDVGILGFNFI